jgi:hypothetical protein
MCSLSVSPKIKTLLPFLLLLLVACGDNKTSIPVMPVSMQINLLQEPSLLSLGATKAYTKVQTGLDAIGFGGVLIVHTYDDAYCAFDLACPYEVKNTVRVEVQTDLSAKCPECGSRYRIVDGSGWVIEGVSKEKLKQYHVYPSGNYLYVTY